MPLRFAIFHLLGLAIFKGRGLCFQVAVALLGEAIVLDANDGARARRVEAIARAETPRTDEPFADAFGIARALAICVGRQSDVTAFGVGRTPVAEDCPELLTRTALR